MVFSDALFSGIKRNPPIRSTVSAGIGRTAAIKGTPDIAVTDKEKGYTDESNEKRRDVAQNGTDGYRVE